MKSKRRSEPKFQGQTLEELIAEVGLDKLDYESCFRGLFSEYFEDDDEDENPTGKAGKAGGATVTQLGPGRRNRPKDE